jgi:hypothetical protein
MFIIPINKEEVCDIPKIKKWIKNLNKLSFTEEEIQKDKIEFLCQFGFFVPKSANTAEKFMESFDVTSKMLFEERLKFELSKVRVDLAIRHEKFFMTDRLPKNVIPDSVYKMVKELTKVKMMVESKMHENLDVLKSIPEIDTSMINIEIFKNIASSEIKTEYDLDSILDKINEKGFDSLSDDEKKFLDDSSKN